MNRDCVLGKKHCYHTKLTELRLSESVDIKVCCWCETRQTFISDLIIPEGHGPFCTDRISVPRAEGVGRPSCPEASLGG